MDDKKLAALARKNAAKEVQPKDRKRLRYDDTLPPEPEDSAERTRLFKEMKKREF